MNVALSRLAESRVVMKLYRALVDRQTTGAGYRPTLYIYQLDNADIRLRYKSKGGRAPRTYVKQITAARR